MTVANPSPIPAPAPAVTPAKPPARKPLFDADEVARAFRLLVPAGGVAEVRALEATHASDRYPGVWYGYFTDPDALVAALAGLRSAEGVYVTLNPVAPALHARAADRLRKAGKKGASVSDADVVARRWLLVDCDAKRPAGISATDREHGLARMRAGIIRDELGVDGWPDPVLADSANGAHLLYRVDLPADDGGLVARVLAALQARFGDDPKNPAAAYGGVAVVVDGTTANAARITKLYGTRGCKGDDTPDRPHRLSAMVDVPDELEAVSREQLEALVAAAEAEAAAEAAAARAAGSAGTVAGGATSPAGRGKGTGAAAAGGKGKIDLAAWVEAHRLDLTGPEDWHGRGGAGKRWVFKTCPWDDAHADGSAFVAQFDGGGVFAGCHHNGCAGKGWHDLRDAVEPGWRDKGRKPQAGRGPDGGAAGQDNLDGGGGGDEIIPLGGRDPGTGRLVLSPKRTLPTAEAFVAEFYTRVGGTALRAYAGVFMGWHGNRWAEVEEGALRQRLARWLHAALRYQWNKAAQMLELVPFESNPGSVNAALETTRALGHLPATVSPPAWLDAADGGGGHAVDGETSDRPDPRELLAFPSGTLHVPTGRVLPPTPALFNVSAIDFEYDPAAPPPLAWLAFLDELWPGDPESVALLQEWFGYSLVGDTGQQKMLLVVGPRRSGKGTIGRVLRRLVGERNVVGPTTSGLAGPFGLQPLLGKSLAVVSDARFAGDDVAVVVERLLCVSGEDAVTVDRKFLPGVTLRLPTRFVFLTNELPRLADASGALAGRFLVLRMANSFYGREDTGLTDRLMAELPGVLLWAVEGLRRLRARGRFAQPAASADALRDMEDLASPVAAFVRERCAVGPGRRAWVDELYAGWRRWCEEDGRHGASTKQTFGRDLVAAVPGLSCRRNHGAGRFYDGIALADPGAAPV
jgi:putative DNA primase/helicase